MSNVKPGDLARIVRSMMHPELNDRFCTVLYEAPIGEGFYLPDGYWHIPLSSNKGLRWLVQFSNPVEAPIGMGKTRKTVYAPIPDANLRPIRDPGDDAADLILAPLPKQDKVPA